MRKEKIAYLQWLRIFAAFAVVLMHTAAKKWYAVSCESVEWQVLTFWDSLVRWPVLVFVMITGALFLPRRTELRTVLTRYIPRIAAAWVVWSGIHAIREGGTAEQMLRAFLSGHYHLWYLPFLCGVYLVIPYVQKIAEDMRLTRQLLAVSCVIALVVPWLADAAEVFLPAGAVYVRTVENQLNFTFFFDHLSILLMGHVLNQTELTPGARRIIYAAGILGVAVSGAGTVWVSDFLGIQNSLFFDHAAPNTLCTAAAIFVFAKYNLTRLPKAVDRLAKYSFGVYLCHALIIEVLADSGFHVLAWNPVWSVPVLSVLVFAIALAVTAAISKLPLIGTYLT